MGTQIRFWKDSYKNEAKSKEAGIPVFDEVDWCEIRVLGEPDTVSGPWAKMPPSTREIWKDAHAQWQKDNGSEGIIGTHLSQVAWLGRGEVETLKYLGIRTVENLASVDDAQITRIPGGLALRQKAKDMLSAAKDSAPLQRMSEELAKRDAQIRDLMEMVKELREGGAPPPVKRGPGRPRKVPQENAQ